MAYKRTRICLAFIFLVAVGLRLWGIWFGLPFSFHPDEHHEVFRALELGSGAFNFERTGKGGYFYVLFVEYGVLFVVLKVAGVVSSAQDFARYFAADSSNFYLIGRATTAVVGAINVILVYRLGARAYSVGAGLLAAVFLTVDFLNVEHSHFVTVDVPMTCLATAALLFAVRMATDGGPRDYIWAAFFASLATTTKFPAILLLFPLLVAHFYYVYRSGGMVRQFFLSRYLWWAVVTFLVVLVVTNPGYLVNPPLPDLFGGGDVENAAGYELDDEGAELPPAPNLFWFYITALAHSMGWPLLLVSFAGAAYALWRRTAADVLLLAFALIFYLALSGTGSELYYPRYILPVIVVLALLAGRLVYEQWPQAGATIAKRALAVTLVVVLVALPAYRSIINNHLLTQPDTRALARQWFEEHIPPGSRVLIEGVKIEPTRLTVPLQDTAENLREYAQFYRTREPGKTKYLNFKMQVLSGPTYDLTLISPSDLELHDLDYFKDAGIQYLVIRPEAFAHSRKTAIAGPAFLEELNNDPDVSLTKRFENYVNGPTGPDIDIYRIDSNMSLPALRDDGQ